MAKPSQANEQTMEEILASIRRMMADDRPAEPFRPGPAAAPVPTPPAAYAANVSRLFGDADEEMAAMSEELAEPENGETATVIELAIAQAVDEAEDEARREAVRPVAIAPVPPTVPRREPPRPSVPEPLPAATSAEPASPPAMALPAADPAPEPAQAAAEALGRTPPLLSRQSGAAVAGAFDDLARAMFAGNTRTVDGLVEDLLRPMLRDWLEDNLPPLVERLVREEIERVSRGRR